MTRRTSLSCPSWCARTHGELLGEDDAVHVSDYAAAGNMLLRLCASTDGATGEEDGPYLLLGTHELTLDHAQDLVQALTAFIAQASGAASPRPGSVVPIQHQVR